MIPEKFLLDYISQGLIKEDPFKCIDINGVGLLVKMAIEKIRMINPNVRIGVCGEHGGDPASIEFFAQIGVDYVSCSPYRVPTARLCTVQACYRLKDQERLPQIFPQFVQKTTVS